MKNKVEEDKPEKPKKKGFGWWRWTVIAVILLGIAVGFYYPSFYKSADEYIGEIIAKIKGEDKTLPLPKVAPASKPESVATSPRPQSILFAKASEDRVANDDAAEVEEVTEEEEIIVPLPEDKPKAKSAAISSSKPDSKNELTELKKRVDVLEEKLTEAAKERQLGAALVVAAMRLKDAAVSGQDFTAELDVLSRLCEGDKEMLSKIAAIRPFANGIKTQNELKNELPVLVKTALKTEGENKGDFWDGVMAKIKTLVVVRKVGENGEGEGESALLVQAEKASSAGDLNAAESALKKLSSAKQEVFKKWCENAQNLLQVEALCDELTKLAITKIAGENESKNK